jgi:large subunit ribosomal protein L30
VTKVTVTQVKSKNGSDKRQIATLQSLGLRRIGHAVEHEPTPQIEGMLHTVRHLVRVER